MLYFLFIFVFHVNFGIVFSLEEAHVYCLWPSALLWFVIRSFWELWKCIEGSHWRIGWVWFWYLLCCLFLIQNMGLLCSRNRHYTQADAEENAQVSNTGSSLLISDSGFVCFGWSDDLIILHSLYFLCFTGVLCSESVVIAFVSRLQKLKGELNKKQRRKSIFRNFCCSVYILLWDSLVLVMYMHLNMLSSSSMLRLQWCS